MGSLRRRPVRQPRQAQGNKGDQNYPLPTDVDWPKYHSVSIWCDRFDVSFGAAALARV